MRTGKLGRLQEAADRVASLTRDDVTPAEIIARLVEQHGAIYRQGDPHRLRCAGVTATCTWSKDMGLLEAWRKNATIRIMKENLA